MLARMGPLGELIEKLPFAGDLLPEGAAVDARELRRIEGMILSMTRDERARPEVIDASRTARIARGSGTRAEQVQGLLERFRAMQGLLSQIGKAGGLMGRIPGLGRMLGGGGPELAGLDPAALALGGAAPNRRAARAAKALARKQRKAKRRHTRRS
jgi:signal recognition particle subunit SRP54